MNPTKNIAELGSLILYYWTYESKFIYAKNIIKKISLNDIWDEEEQWKILSNSSKEDINTLVRLCCDILEEDSFEFHTITGYSLANLKNLRNYLLFTRSTAPAVECLSDMK